MGGLEIIYLKAECFECILRKMKVTMLPRILVIMLFIGFGCSPTNQDTKTKTEEVPDKSKTVGSIEKFDAQLDNIILSEASIEVLAEGFDWTEGPLWVEDGGYLLFSDIPPNQVHKWKEREGVSLYLEPSGYTGTKARGGEPGARRST